jgi:hypothetical protein
LFLFFFVFDSNFLAKSRKSHFYFCNFWLAHRQRLNHCYMLRVCVCLSVINDTDRSRHHQAGLEKERKKKKSLYVIICAIAPRGCCCCSRAATQVPVFPKLRRNWSFAGLNERR